MVWENGEKLSSLPHLLSVNDSGGYKHLEAEYLLPFSKGAEGAVVIESKVVALELPPLPPPVATTEGITNLIV